VTKVWASLCENDCWESCSAGNLLGERVALQVHAGRVVPYIEPPSDKSLGKSLLRGYLLVWLLRERVARQVLVVVAGRVAPYGKLPSAKALGEALLREYLPVELLRERVAS
jgi:hypothetical protein